MPFIVNKKDKSEINQKYYRICKNKTIAKVTVNGVDRYELWKDHIYLCIFKNTFEEAKQEFERLENDR